MKKVLVSIFSLILVLSLSQSAAGQASSNSLNDQLIQAAQNGDTATVQQLLYRGANIEAKFLGSTALIWAAEMGKTDVVRLLLEKGANIEGRSDYIGNTALIWAAEMGKSDVVRLLLEKGAN
ncbi:MAG TPA: ankyrin repeat domain-containing protein, partial [Terracidiphilus sp.]|nr:ankyrin repeat domain-containing protein [Terracidiphilus sp.]